MSVQLILYPQNYEGIHSSVATAISGELVADASFANGITSTYPTVNASPENNALIYAEANSSWKAYRTTGASGAWSASGTPTVTTTLNLPCNGSSHSVCGVYQKISNLVPGTLYELKITVTAGSGNGTLFIGNQLTNNWTGASSATYRNLGNVSNLINGGTTASTMLGTSPVTDLFMATQTEEVLVLKYQSDTGSTLSISNISIKEVVVASTAVNYSDLADGQVICDLYEEEAIPLSLSIDDFKNVAEKTQSYSKDFHLPNTKRNNKIFGHIFEVSRSTGITFNPYIKTRAILKEDSYTLFEGFLQLIDIIDKEGEISYNVNLFSEQVTLKDVLENKTFADINFSELDHAYHITNIKNSWDDNTGIVLAQNLTTSSVAYEAAIGLGNTNVLKYPFVNWKGDFWINAGNGNIGLTNLEQVFRPFIQLRYLVKRIIHEAGFEYFSNFFDSANFKKLFMDFNWGQGLGSSEVMESFNTDNEDETIIYAGTSWTSMELGNLENESPTGIGGTYMSGNTITATNDNTLVQVTYSFYIHRDNTVNVPYTFRCRWRKALASGGVSSIDQTSTKTLLYQSTGISPYEYHYTGTISVLLQDGDTLRPQFRVMTGMPTDKVFQGNGNYMFFGGAVGGAGSWWSKKSVNFFQLSSIQVSVLRMINAIRGELSQWDFLKGIFTMFNLVVIKENEVLRIEPYADIFAKPIHQVMTNSSGLTSSQTQHDWTNKVDISDIKLKPLELKRKVKFSYEEDDSDYSVNVYKKATGGYLYGTLNFDGSTATSSQVTNLTGEEEVIASPFAPTLLRPANELFDTTLTIPHIYSGNDDGTEFEDYENAPRILYNLGVKTLSTNTYYIPLQNGVGPINSETQFLQFGHLSEIPTTSSTLDYNFGSCQLIQPIGFSPVDTLFQVYHSPYYDELYHPDTRIMTLKVHLTPADIQNFKFYDTVVIKNREYRVNKIEYKPKTLAKVEFILIP